MAGTDIAAIALGVVIPRKWAERYYNLKRWNVAEKGGQFAPIEAPDVLVDDVRAFFRELRM
jgi:hypothetical protein